MLIRDHYISAIDRMASRFGRESGDHVIPRDATLPRCIDYAACYLDEIDDDEHYRYNRYMLALTELLTHYGDHRRTPRIVHVDVGCGPGVFSWVVHDYFSVKERGTEIELRAYDSSSEMVRLAGLIWREFDTSVYLDATSDVGELTSRIMQGGPPADVIVSFGHVLAQTSDQKDAIDSFADILSTVRLNSNLVVAVGAQRDPAIQRFHRSIDRLTNALVRDGIKVYSTYPSRGSWIAVFSGQLS